MKRKKLAVIVAFVLSIGVLFAGCSQKKMLEPDISGVTTTNPLLEAEWSQISGKAKGQTVNIYMWGGSDSINNYMDEWAAPRLKEETGVVLNRVPINDTKDIINKLLAEKQVDKKDGSVDIIWINGENFKTAKENDLLFGPFAEKLPNLNQYIRKDAPDIKFDFGQDTGGMEAPWGKAQFVFVYDSDKVKNPPKTIGALKAWIKNNPGKFTYPAPPDFTGSAFVRQILLGTTGGYEQYLKSMDEKTVESKSMLLWDYLNEIEPYLWQQGKTYPESLAKLDQLFSNGEIWMTMGYDSGRAAREIQKGNFPGSARTFVLDEGTLSNNHYLAIPFNAVNKEGAMVAINFLLSPEAQIAKFDPANWGDGMILDPESLYDEDKNSLNAMDQGDAVLSVDELTKHRLPEILAEYVDYFEKSWMEYVGKR